MPTVLRLGSVRIAIFTNDHPPAHVHVIDGNRAEARFLLNCPYGPVEIWDHEGFRLAELNAIGAMIHQDLDRICHIWSSIHGGLHPYDPRGV